MKNTFIKKVSGNKKLIGFLVDNIDQDRFIEWAQTIPSFQKTVFKGYAVKKENLNIVIPKVIMFFQNDIRRCEHLLDIWGTENSFIINFFEIIQTSYLKKHRDFFIKLCSPDFFVLLSGVLDKKIYPDKVLSAKIAEKGRKNEGVTPDNKNIKPALPFIAFTKLICFENDQNINADDPPEEQEQPSKKLSGKLSKKISKLQKELENKDEDIIELRNSMEILKDAVAGLKEDNKSRLSEIGNLKETKDTEIQKSISAYKRQIKTEFETESIRFKLHDKADAHIQVMDFAKKAIALQAKRNNKYGTVQKLRDSFRQLSDLLTELRKAEKDSVLIVPEVKSAIKQLEAQKQDLLDDETFANIFHDKGKNILLQVEKIYDLENLKSSLPLLEMTYENIKGLRLAGFINDRDFNGINTAIKDKLKNIIRYEESSSTDFTKKQSSTFEGMINDKTTREMILVIDGNNILLRKLFNDNELVNFSSFHDARNNFNKKTKEKSGNFREVIIVYDGFEDRVIASENHSIIFTDKSKQIADDTIVNIISLDRNSSYILATDDEGLISRCLSVQVLSSAHCYDFFCSSHMGS